MESYIFSAHTHIQVTLADSMYSREKKIFRNNNFFHILHSNEELKGKRKIKSHLNANWILQQNASKRLINELWFSTVCSSYTFSNKKHETRVQSVNYMHTHILCTVHTEWPSLSFSFSEYLICLQRFSFSYQFVLLWN